MYSLSIYCKDLCFDFQAYVSNNFLVFFFIRISYRSFSEQIHCHVFPRSYSQILSCCFFLFLFSFSLKKLSPSFQWFEADRWFSSLDLCPLLPLTCCDGQSSSSIDFTCLNFFSFYPLFSMFTATAFFFLGFVFSCPDY